jgi:dCMP deaminase
MRQNKFENYMEQATVAAKRSHDAETQVGSVLVKNSTGAVVATGFNGFARGVNDEKLPNVRPDKYEYIIHAEENLVANCARHGISMDDCTIYVTLTPCKKCMRLLWNCGITRVIAASKYRDFTELASMMDLKIDQRDTEEGFVELTYSRR